MWVRGVKWRKTLVSRRQRDKLAKTLPARGTAMKRWEGLAHGRLSFPARALVVAIGCANLVAQAQETPPAETAAEQPTTAEVPAATDLLAPEQLDILVAPVALYPDPLLVLILQGSTFPVDVVAAHRFLGKLPEQPELQPDPDWDSSRCACRPTWPACW
jgi:Protein of unknown function (DUF3300)